MKPLSYFRERAQVTAGGCWEWQKHVAVHGYGVFRDSGRTALAHRGAWEAAHEEALGARLALHSCDNPKCVNPDHLFAGDHRANMADRNRKGRARGGSQPGVLHPMASLTADEVKQIRELSGALPQREIARRFGVTQGHISTIINQKRWANAQ